MNKGYDFFLNYSKSDNNQSGSKNWIEVLKTYVPKVLTEMLGFSPAFSESVQDFEQSKVRIHLLSDHFLKDSSCLDRATKRDFFVSRQPVALPEHLQGVFVYVFFSKKVNSAENEYFEEFKTSGNGETNGFWLFLIDLCYDLRDSLLRSSHNLSKIGKGKVYLAQSGFDILTERILVKSELQRYGYEVHPNFIPRNENEIKQALKGCSFSIHLVGREYGELLNGSAQSLIDLENRICFEHQNTNNQTNQDKFGRLIWFSPTADDLRGKQALFVEKIKREALSEGLTDLVQCRIEDFRILLMQKLALKPTEIEVPGQLGSKENRIYVVSDLRDASFSVLITKYLVENGFQVLSLPFDLRGQQRQNLHRKYLTECNAVLICYNLAKRTWLVSKFQDILKSKGLGRKAGLPKLIVVSNYDLDLNEIKELVNFYPQQDVKYISEKQESSFRNVMKHLS